MTSETSKKGVALHIAYVVDIEAEEGLALGKERDGLIEE